MKNQCQPLHNKMEKTLIEVTPENLDEVILILITTSKAIGLCKFLSKNPKFKSPKNVASFLDYDILTLELFSEAVRMYDSLPARHDLKNKAPYDLVHNAEADVIGYYHTNHTRKVA